MDENGWKVLMSIGKKIEELEHVLKPSNFFTLYEVYIDAPLDDGVIHGDIWIRTEIRTKRIPKKVKAKIKEVFGATEVSLVAMEKKEKGCDECNDWFWSISFEKFVEGHKYPKRSREELELLFPPLSTLKKPDVKK